MGFGSVLKKLFANGDTLEDRGRNVPEDQSSHFKWVAGPPKDPGYFRDLFVDAFPGCQVEEDVPASRFEANAHPACVPISFLIRRAGQPVLAIALVRMNNYRGMNVIATKEIVERAGIPYMRFFVELPNEPDYVLNRVRNAL